MTNAPDLGPDADELAPGDSTIELAADFDPDLDAGLDADLEVDPEADLDPDFDLAEELEETAGWESEDDPEAVPTVGAMELAERHALRRVAGLSTELEDISEVEYRQLRLE